MIPRDKMHRCPICKKLFKDDACTLELNKDGGSDTGLQCPDGCKPSFDQPPYESPIND